MPVNLKEKVAIVVDNGIFFEAALKLSDYFKEVLYYVEWKESYPGMTKAMIGTEWKDGKQLDTFDGKPFRRIENLFDHIEEADILVFLDIYNGDMQAFLAEHGYLVFGPRKGEELELERWDTKQHFKKEGMDVQGIKRVIGIDALRKELKTDTDKWVKISKFRRVTETFHHLKYELSEPILQKIEFDLGPLSKIVEFIIEDNIEAIVEEGVDTYTADGKFPAYLITGVEIKDAAYLGEFVPYDKLSKGNKRVNEQIAPTLKEYGYRGLFSSEIRTTKEGKNYFIDVCARAGSPPNEVYQEMYSNFGEIVWETAQGNIIDPIPENKFAMLSLITSEWFMGSHQAVFFPEKYRDNIKLKNCVKIDGNYYCLNIDNCSIVGAVVATGKTIKECKEKVIEISKTIEGQGVAVKIPELDGAIEEFNKMTGGEQKGTDKE